MLLIPHKIDSIALKNQGQTPRESSPEERAKLKVFQCEKYECQITIATCKARIKYIHTTRLSVNPLIGYGTHCVTCPIGILMQEQLNIKIEDSQHKDNKEHLIKNLYEPLT